MANKLLDLGADPNYADKNGDTPLIKAIWSTMTSREIFEYDQVFDVIKKLVALGCDINAVNDSGRTALFTAVYQNNTEIALFLINQNAKFELEDDVIMGNYTLLHYACFQGNLVLVRALLERNFSVNSAADYNETPIHIATTKGYLDIIDVLIDHGANVNVFTGDENDNKCTLLQAAIYYISDFHLFRNIVDRLIMGGANLTIDKPGPLLILCLQYDKYNFAKYLVSLGADIEQRTIFNQSCFYKGIFINLN
jgi:ankyrin repeat protein